MMAKRLAAFPTDLSTCEGSVGMQLGIIDCLRTLLLSLMQAAATRADTKDTLTEAPGKEGENVNLAVRQAVEGILSPLRTAVDAVRSSASGGSSEKTSASIRLHAGTTVSPLVLTSALRVLEEIVWRCACHVTPHDVLEKTVAETPLIAAARLAVTRVLGALQQYLVLLQQHSMESAAGSIEKSSLARLMCCARRAFNGQCGACCRWCGYTYICFHRWGTRLWRPLTHLAGIWKWRIHFNLCACGVSVKLH
ncbi:hypothetical protein C3747_195g36 [Trypanosoma cruzi]|uniref:Uncharacterized protein n=1 Tax=Trypanosoma cruzi TaxID=5693 RepID=A0A2V2VZM4_TRYCR|nr:hypothetical protein C3747_195g36 [Trypanosoma cruzi]